MHLLGESVLQFLLRLAMLQLVLRPWSHLIIILFSDLSYPHIKESHCCKC